jgi:hypothetical protein
MDMLFSQVEPEMRNSGQTTLTPCRLKPGGRDNRCRGGPTRLLIRFPQLRPVTECKVTGVTHIDHDTRRSDATRQLGASHL